MNGLTRPKAISPPLQERSGCENPELRRRLFPCTAVRGKVSQSPPAGIGNPVRQDPSSGGTSGTPVKSRAIVGIAEATNAESQRIFRLSPLSWRGGGQSDCPGGATPCKGNSSRSTAETRIELITALLRGRDAQAGRVRLRHLVAIIDILCQPEFSIHLTLVSELKVGRIPIRFGSEIPVRTI